MLRKIIIVGLFFVIASACINAGTIKVVVQDEMMTKKWFSYVADEYNNTHQNNKVELLFLSGSENNFFTKLQLMLKSDSSVDVIYEAENMIESDVQAGLLSNLDSLKKWDGWKEFYSRIRDRGIVDNHVFGVPLSTDTRGLFYSKNIFKKAGIKIPWQPKNWNDIFKACKIIKEKVPTVAPFTMNVSSNGEATSIQTLQMLLSGTSDSLFKNGKWIVTSDGLYNSFKFINDMCRNNYTPRLGVLLNQQYGNIMLNTLAPKKQAAIILDGCWATGRWAQNSPETLKDYSMIPFPTEFGQEPGYTSMSGGWLLSVNAKSLHKKEAEGLIEFALNKKNLLQYTKMVNNLSTRKDVAKMKGYPSYLKIPTDFLNFTHFRPANTNYAVVSSKLQTAVEEVAVGSKTPLQAMNSFADSVERTLGKNKIIKEFKNNQKRQEERVIVKRIAVIVLLSVVGILLSGCGKNNKDDGKTHMKIVYKAGYTKWIEDTIKEYEKENPDVKVDLNLIGGTDADYYTKLSLLLKTDSSTDIIFEDSFLLQNMVSSGLLAPINEITKWQDWKQFYPAFRKSATIDGNLYGVPISTDVRGLFYNKNIFKKLDIKLPWQPKNWQDIIKTCEEIKRYGHGIIPFSMNVGAYGEQTTMQTLEMLLYGTNSPLYKNGKWVVKSKGLLNSLIFISDIFEKELGPKMSVVMNKQYSTMIFETYAANQSIAIFLDGCWGMNFWKRKHPQTLNIYDFVPMPTEFGQEPGHISMSGGWLFAVNAKSKNKQAAIDFIKFAASKKNYLKYSEMACELTPRKDVIDSPEFPKDLKKFADFMKFTHFRPANSQYPVVSNYIQKMVEGVATQSTTPKDAMNEFAANVERTLSGNAVTEENIK